MGVVFVGCLLLLHAAVRLIRLIASVLSAPEVPVRRLWRQIEGGTVLASGVAVFVVLNLLAVGVIPAWYYPSTGSYQQPIPGCQWVGGGGILSFPDAFPPGARVHLTWATTNSTNVSFTAFQEAPNSINPDWRATENGSAGDFSFTGSGGEMWVAANPVAYCPTLQHVQVGWSYSLPVW